MSLLAFLCSILVAGVAIGDVSSRPFGISKYGESVTLFALRGKGGLTMEVLNYGCKVRRLLVPDGNGDLADVAIGFDSPEGWDTLDPYFGAVVGRYASYIANGRFELDGKEYVLEKNDAEHDTHLHGGRRGWNDYVWDAKPFRCENGGVGIVFVRVSPDGEEGYPGRVEARVTYTITPDNVWRIDYEATTDKPTPINLTQHTLFDLNGRGEGLDQLLQVFASKYSPVDRHFTPVGTGRPVAGTPFDFRTFRRIGQRIDEPDVILQYGPGYDHNWELDGAGFRKVAELRGEKRAMEVWTDQIGLQVYAGNYIKDGWKMRDGCTMRRRGWIALETQHFPDSPNRSDYPSTILRPGERYVTRTEYRFSPLRRMRPAVLVDRIEDGWRYAGANPNLPKAFAFLRQNELRSLKPGRYEIDGSNCWAFVEEYVMAPAAERMTYEVHRNYIDVQAPLLEPEVFGTMESSLPSAAYDQAKDVAFAEGAGNNVTVRPGEFILFDVDTGAHATGVTDGAPRRQRKVVVKVRRD